MRARRTGASEMLPNLKREIDQIAKDKGIDTMEIIGAL